MTDHATQADGSRQDEFAVFIDAVAGLCELSGPRATLRRSVRHSVDEPNNSARGLIASIGGFDLPNKWPRHLVHFTAAQIAVHGTPDPHTAPLSFGAFLRKSDSSANRHIQTLHLIQRRDYEQAVPVIRRTLYANVTSTNVPDWWMLANDLRRWRFNTSSVLVGWWRDYYRAQTSSDDTQTADSTSASTTN